MFERPRSNANIALMCTSLNNMAGGLERQIILTAKLISSFDYNVYLVSFDSPGDQSFYSIPANIQWLQCGEGLTPHKSASKLQRFKQLLSLRQRLSKLKISCLITFHHGLYARSFFATFLTRTKNIVSERNSLTFYNYIRGSKYNAGFLLSFLADARTVQIESYKQEYPRLFRGNIHTIPNITSYQDGDYKTPNLYSKKVAMLGRLEAQKNFIPLLDQMILQMSNLNFTLAIAGEGSLRSLIQQKYSRLIKYGFLELLGNVSETHRFLSSCSLFCFPSLWEGFPNALLEALYCGLPIVSTPRLRGLHDFIEQDYNADIVDDPNLFSSISSLIADQYKLTEFSLHSFSKYKRLSLQRPDILWSELVSTVLR